MIMSRSKALSDSEIHASIDNSFSTTDSMGLSKVAVRSVNYEINNFIVKKQKLTNQCCPQLKQFGHLEIQ